MRSHRGFALLEMIIAASITAAVVAGLFVLMRGSQAAFAAEPEAADMQQRLRVASDALTRDLRMAGAGAYSGPMAGPLNTYFAPVLPYRRAASGGDPPATFRDDAITLLYVPSTASQTTLAADLAPGASAVVVNIDPGCPLGDAACGFAGGDTVLVYDRAGHFDTFWLTSVAGNGGTLTAGTAGTLSASYAAGSKVVAAAQRAYWLKQDSGSPPQLVVSEGSSGTDKPVIDHAVGLHFSYFGDAASPSGCVLSPGAPAALVALSPSELADGPWCPDAVSANRFDADLLRIRKISVTVRVEAAIDALRGPAGVLFARAGTGRAGATSVADQEIVFQVSPRNLNLER